MKIFQRVIKQYAVWGFSASNQSNYFESINERIFGGFFLFGCLIFSHFMYIFHVATDFMEYMEGICTTCATTIVCVCSVSIVARKSALFEVIDNMGKLIDTSKTSELIKF